MEYPLKRKTTEEQLQAQLNAVRLAYWDGMTEDGPEYVALRDAIDRSGLLSEPAGHDEVKILMGFLPRETLGAAIAFGLDHKDTIASIELFLAGYAGELRKAFNDPEAEAYQWDLPQWRRRQGLQQVGRHGA